MRIQLFFFFILLFTACRKEICRSIASSEDLLSVESLNQRIWLEVKQHERMDWSNWEEHALWSAVAHADSLVAIGYKPIDFVPNADWIANVRLDDPSWRASRQAVLTLLDGSKQISASGWNEPILPVILVRIQSALVLSRLLRSPNVRYIEPLSYDKNLFEREQQLESSSGCGSNTPSWDIKSGLDYIEIGPSAKMSWNYSGHGIPVAWNRTTGKGVKVFLIDTGCSWGQDNLGVSFNSGASYGRTLERIVTLPQDTWLGFPMGLPETSNDGCGHGTSMAGAMAAPRSSDGNAVGIAYNCNLVTCRAAADVFLDESREVKGVVDAFTNAANRSDVRIISMSTGRITSSSYIQDAVRYAYGKGKLIFSAAGTSFSWTSGWAGVIFPASMPEIQAVTGVKDLSSLTGCEVCHKGPAVDFVVTMERAADGKHPLTLADLGDWPSTVGGSSVATASMAGMAALVWARFPSRTRDQVIVQLQRFSSAYPYKTTNYGWGRLDVARATQ